MKKEVVINVSAPQKAVLNSTASINLFMAGYGSGKSFLNGIIAYRFITMFPESIGFVGANYYDQLNSATFFRIREFWKMIGITEYDKQANPDGVYVVGRKPPSHFNLKTHNFESYNNIVSFINGAIIFLGSLDNYEAHAGKEMNYAILDETKDTDEEAVKDVILGRLRRRGIYMVKGNLSNKGKDSQQYNPLYITTSPAKTQWINEWFELEKHIEEINNKIFSKTAFFQKKENGRFVAISSTWHNIQNVGENYIQNIIDNNTEERAKALIYGSPFMTLGGEFYSSFARLKHVGNLKYNPDQAVHLSFDQNTVPYNSCSIWQAEKIDEIWQVRCIDEIALVNPRNSTQEVCEEFSRRYPRHQAGLFYYGDASGRNRSTLSKDFKHHYEVVAFRLRKYLHNSSDRTLRVNPSVIKRRDFINRIFEDKLPIRIMIDESCKLMISDMMYVKQAADGGKDKSIYTDKETGEKYQRYGHLGDTLEYLMVEMFRTYFS